MLINTLRQLTPFLLNEKCAKYFSSWSEQQNLYQSKITKESIIDVVQKFEQQKDLQLNNRKKLPAHLGFGETFSAIDVNTFKTETTVAKYAQDQKPSFQQRSSSRDRSDSHMSRTPQTSRSRDRSTGGQHHSNRRQGSRSPGPHTQRSSSGPHTQRSNSGSSPGDHPMKDHSLEADHQVVTNLDKLVEHQAEDLHSPAEKDPQATRPNTKIWKGIHLCQIQPRDTRSNPFLPCTDPSPLALYNHSKSTTSILERGARGSRTGARTSAV